MLKCLFSYNIFHYFKTASSDIKKAMYRWMFKTDNWSNNVLLKNGLAMPCQYLLVFQNFSQCLLCLIFDSKIQVTIGKNQLMFVPIFTNIFVNVSNFVENMVQVCPPFIDMSFFYYGSKDCCLRTYQLPFLGPKGPCLLNTKQIL